MWLLHEIGDDPSPKMCVHVHVNCEIWYKQTNGSAMFTILAWYNGLNVVFHLTGTAFVAVLSGISCKQIQALHQTSFKH